MNRACVSLAIVTVSLCSCALDSKSRGSIADVVGASQHRLEVASTTDDLARDEVLKSPTDFEVSIEQDRYAWERTHLFLESYVDPKRAPLRPITKVVGARWGLANPPVQSGYLYEVWREAIPDGFHYSVRCVASAQGSQQQATLNAANLARFIRDGKLEVSLLPAAAPET